MLVKKAKNPKDKGAKEDEKRDYHGVPLFYPEYASIVELEEQLRMYIPYVTEIEWKTFGFMEQDGHVTGLSLFKQGIERLPESICNLHSLEVFRLHRNDFRTFPEAICKLPSLRILDLRENNLTKLPNCIGQLQSLKELLLKNNYLRSLPEEIGNLHALEILNLNNNWLKKLPESITNLKSLKQILIGYNQKPFFLPLSLKEWIAVLEKNECIVQIWNIEWVSDKEGVEQAIQLEEQKRIKAKLQKEARDREAAARAEEWRRRMEMI